MSEAQTDALQNSNDGGNEQVFNERVFKWFISEIDSRILKEFQERANRNRILIIGLLTAAATASAGLVVLAIFLMNLSSENTVLDATLTAIRTIEEEKRNIEEDLLDKTENQVSEEFRKAALSIEQRIESIVAVALEKELGVYDLDVRIVALQQRVLALDISTSFASEEADLIIREIQALYNSAQDAQRRAKLSSPVEIATKNFASAGRLDLVAQIEDMTPEFFESSQTILQVMIQALGNRLLADADAPHSWLDEGGLLKETYSRYRKYAGRASDAGYPELYLVYELLLRFVEESPDDRITGLIDATDILDPEDSANFVSVITALATGSFSSDDAISTVVTSRVEKFLCMYGEQGSLLRLVSGQATLNCPLGSR